MTTTLVSRPEQSRARYPDAAGHVERDGVRVFWERYGDGEPTVVLLPSWALGHSRNWKGQIPYLARHFRVVTIDPRGNGRSDRPQDPAVYAVEQQAGDVIEVMGTTGTRSAVLVSAGPSAQRALLIATSHPERVDGVVFLVPDLWIAPRYVEHFLKEEQDEYEGWDRFSPHYWRRDWPGFVDWWMRLAFPEPHSTKHIEDAIGYALETDAETMIAATLGQGGLDRDSVLELCRRLDVPVLVIRGQRNPFVPIDMEVELAQASGGELVTIPGAGPVPQARWPVAVNLRLRRFMEGVAAAR